MSEKYCTEIDEFGFVVEVYPLNDTEIENFEGTLLVDVYPPSGVGIPIRPRWDGQKWVEGATQIEIAAIESERLLASLQPSAQDLADADLEIKMLTLLFEMGVLQ